jgi:hypothetical protein
MAARSPWSRIAPVGAMHRWAYYSPGSLTAANGQNTGTMSYSIFSIQWGSTTKIFQPTQIEFQWSLATTFTTQADLAFGLFVVRSFTAAPSGGTAATFTATQNLYSGRFDTNFDKTEFNANGDFRIATTGNLTAGTGNIDKYPMRIWMGNAAISGGIAGMTSQNPMSIPFEVGNDPNTQSPFIRYQEGLSIQPLATMGAVGVLNLSVGIEWIEMPTQFY